MVNFKRVLSPFTNQALRYINPWRLYHVFRLRQIGIVSSLSNCVGIVLWVSKFALKMPPKLKFGEGERILCYHGPLIYEAKCMKGQMKDKVTRYLIHYNGWNKNWDEWVPENRVLKFNEANLQKQRELREQNSYVLLFFLCEFPVWEVFQVQSDQSLPRTSKFEQVKLRPRAIGNICLTLWSHSFCFYRCAAYSKQMVSVDHRTLHSRKMQEVKS